MGGGKRSYSRDAHASASPPRCEPSPAAATKVDAAGATVGEVLDDVASAHPAFRDRLFDGEELRRFVNIYVNNEDIRYLDDLDTR